MITIKKHVIKLKPENEVTSDKVFKSRKIIDENGNYLYHEDGIFSERIFGKFNRCKCGELTRPGICPKCGVRVLNKKSMPDFYIDFSNLLDIPYMQIDDPSFTDKSIAEGILSYKGFVYDGEYVEFDLKTIDTSKYDTDKVKIGKDAILELGGTDEWYEKQVRHALSVPHTSLRRITAQNGQYILGTLNTILINIIRKKRILTYYSAFTSSTIFAELNNRRYILQQIEDMNEELFMMIAKNNSNLVDREFKGQGLTGIIRAVITNNFSLDEDTALIGKYFIKTLYPKIYDQFTVDGVTDVEGINEYLEDNDYYVLLNRQPTIGAKSIIGMRPKFSTKDDEKYVIQLNPIIFEGLAGDCDGDVLSITALYTKAACEEASRLIPSRNYIEGSNSSIRNGLPEDFVYVMEKMYSENTETAEDIEKLINE